jgi:hypothetical protein
MGFHHLFAFEFAAADFSPFLSMRLPSGVIMLMSIGIFSVSLEKHFTGKISC